MADLMMSTAGLILVCGGAAAASMGRWRDCWRLLLAGNVTHTAADIIWRRWPLLAVNAVLVIICAWLLWLSRRGQR